MPNHVTNRLTITGDAEAIKELAQACLRKEKQEIPKEWLERIEKGDDYATYLKKTYSRIGSRSVLRRV